MSLNYANDPQIESGLDGGVGGGSQSPGLLFVGQAQGIAVANALPPTISQNPIVTMRLKRAPSTSGPWTQVDERDLSPTATRCNLFDVSPLTTTLAYYAVTAVDSASIESGMSNVMPFAFIAKPRAISVARPIAAAAFGTYPLLGSDVFVDPVTREGVVGLNGDLLTVNGLECLAQDLRTRVTTEQGELLLQQDFGNGRTRLIGSGQADPVSQAQILRTRLIDALLKDARVAQVVDVIISRTAVDAWIASCTIIAIGQEDPQHLNLVFPYYLS